MTIFIKGHTFGYELQRVVQMFFPGERVTVEQELPQEVQPVHSICISLEDTHMQVRGRFCNPEGAPFLMKHGDAFDPCKPFVSVATDTAALDDTPQTLENKFAVMLYKILEGVTGLRPPWGTLTGIRPVKLFLRQIEQGADEPALRRHFIDNRLLDESRFSLALETARAEQAVLVQSRPKDFSLYVSIPFCPSRCAYCSFVSHSIEKAQELIEPYLDRLCEEIEETARLTDSLGLRLRTVYFGGGTPTALSATQLKRLMDAVAARFDQSELLEYTVEAGRPDTIDREKLEVIRAGGAGRISINPQTLSDNVLRAIGRRHTTEQAMQTYRLAREIGFDAINMDLIAGLPTDTVKGFRASMDGVLAVAPENVTVHTLTLKRAAALRDNRAALEELHTAREMVDYARAAAAKVGLSPYYLYRQNGSLSSLENVGYARSGALGIYNIYIMNESHSILAVGAGGSTKLCDPARGAVKRIYNHKYPYEYISRFEEILRRKQTILAFYQQERKEFA